MIESTRRQIARNSAPKGIRLLGAGALNGICRWPLRSTCSWTPVSVKIGVNSVCNARCLTCDVGTKNVETPFFRNNTTSELRPDMPFELATRIIDQLSSVRPQICIDSTEPLLYRDLGRLVRYVKSRRMSCLVLTNGLLLADRARKIVDSGLDELVVSIDGPAEVNDSVRRVPGLTEKAFSGIQEMHRLKQRIGGSTGPKIKVNVVISEHTQHTLAELLSTLRDLEAGIAAVTLYHQNFISPEMSDAHNRAWGTELPVTAANCASADPSNVDPDSLAAMVGTVERTDFPFRIRWVPYLRSPVALRRFYTAHLETIGSGRCLAPWMILRVRPDGETGIIARCIELSLGNCCESDILSIFNGAGIRRLRRILLDHGPLPACFRCCGAL